MKFLEKVTGQRPVFLTKELLQAKEKNMLYSKVWDKEGKSEITLLLYPLNS